MTSLKKMLLKADPSANVTNKDAVLGRFREGVDLTTAPKAGRNWVRLAVAAACVCLILAGSVSTGLAQIAIEYVKEVFYTKEIVEIEDVSGQISFAKMNDVERSSNEDELIIRESEIVSLEEAKNAFDTPFKVPQVLPRDLSFNRIDLFKEHQLTYVNIKYDDGDFGMNIHITPSKNMSVQFFLDEGNTTFYKYTVGDIEIYSYSRAINEANNYRTYAFVDGDFMYTFSVRFTNELTDEEFVEMIESMS